MRGTLKGTVFGLSPWTLKNEKVLSSECAGLVVGRPFVALAYVEAVGHTLGSMASACDDSSSLGVVGMAIGVGSEEVVIGLVLSFCPLPLIFPP